ncbi:hypothetical protein BDQ17DRAFT_1351775 [Cyathus striatus]|nr:hypothetical protein BDQ17DRAFT_1351775 [Cyathus striatus]
MLSRSQFDAACDGFLCKYEHPSSDLSVHCIASLTGWSWVEQFGYGFMTRSSTVSQLLEDAFDEQTAPRVSPSLREYLTMNQHVVYSASFQVPFFTLQYTIVVHGSPLSLEEILHTTLFKHDVSKQAETTTFALTLPMSAFPLLSQGEHPVLGTPCWYLHPCESDNAIRD